MPRVMNVGPSGQSHGGLFGFDGDYGRVVDAWYGNNQIQQLPPTCGLFLELQYLGPDWQPIANKETRQEFLGCGKTTFRDEQRGTSEPNFHPGLADSKDDVEVNFGTEKDLDETVWSEGVTKGNCFISRGKGPDAKGKHSVFVGSCLEAGFPVSFFEPLWPADLIGLEARFTQQPILGVDNKKSGEPPTGLVIGRSGKIAGGKDNIHKYPDNMTGEGQAKPNPAATAGAGAGASVANGVPAPSLALSFDVEKTLTAKLEAIAAKKPLPYLVKKLATRMESTFAVLPEMPKDTQSINAANARLKTYLFDEKWLRALAADNEWKGVSGSGDTLTLDMTPE